VAHETGAEIAPVHDVLGRIAAGEITETKDAGSEMSCQRWLGKISVWASLVLQLAMLQAGAGWAWAGKVVGIADGDTITVLRDEHDQVKIRLYGVDAPEFGQPFGKASKQNLSSMVYRQSVQIEVMDTDHLGEGLAD